MQGRARYALSQALALGKRDYAAARAAVEPNLALISPDDIWNREMTQLQLGLLDWRLGAVEDAESRLVEALTLAKELAHPFGIAACLEILAWVAMTRDEPARAAQLVGYAHGLFDRTGTNFVTGLTADQHDAAERMREQLGSGRYRVLTQAGAEMSENEVMRLAQRQVAAPDEHQDASLTAREREVAKLIAGGATNTQISLQLLIGHETVKTHVRSILRKLGLDSRVQIAAWYATGGRDGQQILGR
jgi:non-specific serine/threonine protein kinase